MATLPEIVAPFRGERYSATERLSQLLAPPYDVIAPELRSALAARDEHNIVHLMLPEAPAGFDRYGHAARLLDGWRDTGVLVRDREPAVYLMAQTFTVPSGERRTRTGMFAAVAAEGYGPRRIRPHERTHRGPKADRLALLRATRTNLESILLLAPDPEGTLARALRDATTSAAPEVITELDGVDIRLWVVRGDPSPLPLPASPLYIADGHHRFETACAYAVENPHAERLLGFIVSARDEGLVVLPTHRVVYGARSIPGHLLDAWRERFDVRPLAPGGDPLAALAAAGDRTTCVVLAPGGQEFLLALKSDADLGPVIAAERDAAVRSLDVARVEHLVVREIIGAAASTVTLDYVADGMKAVRAARTPRSAAVAVLVNPTRVEQVFAVADAGGVMPPKSTYFAPKVPSGVVLRPLD